MKKTFLRLIEATAKCRDDMHEPDEQAVEAVVAGYKLDNAFGDSPHDNCAELTVGLKINAGLDDEHIEWFNLATLIAIARCANAARLTLIDKGISL
jgi:hypothetical protein